MMTTQQDASAVLSRWLPFVGVLALLMSVGVRSAPGRPPIDPIEADAIIAESGLFADQAQIVHFKRFELPYTEQTILAAKVMDLEAGEVLSVYLDALLDPVDFDEPQADELEAYDALHGRRHHPLNERLKRAAQDEIIPVAIWLDSPDTSGAVANVRAAGFELEGNKPVGANAQAARSALIAAKVPIYTAHNQPTVNAIQALGGQIDYTNTLAPLVFASLTPASGRVSRMQIAECGIWIDRRSAYERFAV